jgi:dinuclear metal center YbgI/SA1388 family protein
MIIQKILKELEKYAPLSYQDEWDNSGIMVGNPTQEVSGVMISLDVTLPVISEAISQKCNLIISHHPLIFKPLRHIVAGDPSFEIIREAFKNDLVIYAMHTNLDNAPGGINQVLADRFGLEECMPLRPQRNGLSKLITFAPTAYAQKVRESLFKAGGGHIGHYDTCSFSVKGLGTFRAGEGTDPFVGLKNEVHVEEEERIEVIFPKYLEGSLIEALQLHHPYEEVAYDIYPLSNPTPMVGAGIIGTMQNALDRKSFLSEVKKMFKLDHLGCSRYIPEKIRKLAICGGAGSFLIPDAKRAGADAFLTGDIKYHTFESDGSDLLLADIGHFESEQVAKELLYTILKEKFPNFAVFISKQEKNPITYV